MNRRKFLGILGGAIAAPVVLVKAEPVKALEEVFELTYEENSMFQWYSGYSTLVTETIRKKAPLIAENISSNNILLERLNARKKSIL